MITRLLQNGCLAISVLAVLHLAACGRDSSDTKDDSPVEILEDRMSSALNEDVTIVWATAYTETPGSEQVPVDDADFHVSFRVTAIIRELTDSNGEELPPEQTRLTVSLFARDTLDYPGQQPSSIEGELTHSLTLEWLEGKWTVTDHQVSFRDFPGLPDGSNPNLFMPFEKAFQDEHCPSALSLIDERELKEFVEGLFTD